MSPRGFCSGYAGFALSKCRPAGDTYNFATQSLTGRSGRVKQFLRGMPAKALLVAGLP